MLKRKIFKYLKNFGLYHGLYLFFYVRRGSEPVIRFRLPRLPELITLRRQSSDIMVFEEIFIDEQYRTSLGPGSVSIIVDAGANVGLSALYFRRQFPKATIICLEPEVNNFMMLKKNLGGYKNIVLLQNGLWHSREKLTFINMEASSWAFEVKPAGQEELQIEGVSLNDIIINYGLARIDLLKIDIEGSEKEVFESNTEWITRVDHIIVEVHENMRPGAHRAVTDLSANNNFTWTNQSAQYFLSKTNGKHS